MKTPAPQTRLALTGAERAARLLTSPPRLWPCTATPAEQSALLYGSPGGKSYAYADGSGAAWATQTMYCGTTHGVGRDNPADPATLSGYQRRRALMAELTNVSSVQLRFSIVPRPESPTPRRAPRRSPRVPIAARADRSACRDPRATIGNSGLGRLGWSTSYLSIDVFLDVSVVPCHRKGGRVAIATLVE